MKTFRRVVGSFIVLFFGGQAWSQSVASCFDYEQSAVALTGVVVQRTYPGLPNFESIKEGDRPETSWLLVLARPICVDGKSGDLVNVAQTNVREIQLVFENHESYQSYRRLLRRRAIVTGELLGAITGHDHTEVLLIVSSIRSEKDDVWHLNFSNSRRRSPLTLQQFSHIHTEGAENARKAAAYIAEHGPLIRRSHTSSQMAKNLLRRRYEGWAMSILCSVSAMFFYTSLGLVRNDQRNLNTRTTVVG